MRRYESLRRKRHEHILLHIQHQSICSFHFPNIPEERFIECHIAAELWHIIHGEVPIVYRLLQFTSWFHSSYSHQAGRFSMKGTIIMSLSRRIDDSIIQFFRHARLSDTPVLPYILVLNSSMKYDGRIRPSLCLDQNINLRTSRHP